MQWRYEDKGFFGKSWVWRFGQYSLFEHPLGWKPVGHKAFVGVYLDSLGAAFRLIENQPQ